MPPLAPKWVGLCSSKTETVNCTYCANLKYQIFFMKVIRSRVDEMDLEQMEEILSTIKYFTVNKVVSCWRLKIAGQIRLLLYRKLDD